MSTDALLESSPPASRRRRIAKGSATFDVVGGEGALNDAFWDWFQSDDWEPETVAIFDRLLGPETRYVDLGAWIGPTVLLAAHRVNHLVCFEPDAIARAELLENLGLNPDLAARVSVHGEAVAAADGVLQLNSPTTGGDSLSSAIRRRGDLSSWEVPAVGINTFLATAEGAGATFFKVDVEGSEYWIVPALREYITAHRPSIYLALHPNFVFDKTSLRSRLASALTLVRLNHALLRTLAGYRHHWVYDARRRRFRDVRRRNLLRLALPLPVRAAILVGSCLFTDESM